MYGIAILAILAISGCAALDEWSKEFDPLLLRYENLPTCDFRAPEMRVGEHGPLPGTKRCREVKGQWGGTVDGRINQP